MQEELLKHLKTGSTTICRAWLVRRKDGVSLGFTDHDSAIIFDGVEFSAKSGLTAQNIEKSLGLAVDNTEVVGALSDESLNETDIIAGRYDGAEVTAFLVNWSDVNERSVIFKGTFGDMTRSQGAFRVELRGLTEALNIRRGRVYHPDCSAALGDSECKVDLSNEAMTILVPLLKIENGRILHFTSTMSHDRDWFKNGQAIIHSGGGIGQIGRVRTDMTENTVRKIELWHAYGQRPEPGDEIRLVVGCDKRASVCRQKFNNFINFRGFPHIPGEDWMRAGPSSAGRR